MDTLLREDLNSPLSVSMTLGVINILFDEFPSFVCRGVAFDLCKETPPQKKQKQRYNWSTCNCRPGIRKSERFFPHSFLFSNPKSFGTIKLSILNPNKTKQGYTPLDIKRNRALCPFDFSFKGF